MKQFSTRDLAQLSGIKAHTIRIWEQRYSLLTPQRTDANLRIYDIGDLKLLLNISLLVNNGFKISKIVMLDHDELTSKVATMRDNSIRQSRSVNELIYHMYAINVSEFDEVVEGALLSWGFDATMRDIVVPFLAKVQLLSYRNNNTEAHFAVTSIRRKLMFGIESLNTSKVDHRTVLLFLPKDEHYDLMLLYTYYLLKKSGLKPLYLGTNISLSNLQEVCMNKKPSLLFSYSSSDQLFRLKDYGTLLDRCLIDSTLYVVYADAASYLRSIAGNMQFLDYRDVERVVDMQTVPGRLHT